MMFEVDHDLTQNVLNAGLTVASIGGAVGYIAGALGYAPVIIAAVAGIAAIASYTFQTLDSPTFQRWWHGTRSKGHTGPSA